MTAEEYLRQLRSLDILINAMLQEKERLFAMATKVNAPLSDCKVQTSPDKSKTEEIIIKMTALGETINNQVDHYVDLKTKVTEQINMLSDTRYRVLLYMRYINGYSFAEIAQRMDYEIRWVMSLHGRALQEFWRINKQDILMHMSSVV